MKNVSIYVKRLQNATRNHYYRMKTQCSNAFGQKQINKKHGAQNWGDTICCKKGQIGSEIFQTTCPKALLLHIIGHINIQYLRKNTFLKNPIFCNYTGKREGRKISEIIHQYFE